MLEIFKTGKHTDSRGVTREFDAAIVAEIAASYDPQRYRAPIFEGHDESKPNVGLIQAVQKAGEKLYALPYKVTGEFREKVTTGRYPAVSVRLYHPQDPSNPVPTKWGLRHLAFVQIPAVKGMEAPSFAETEYDVVITFEEVMPQLIDFTEPIKETEMTVTKEALDAREATIVQREQAITDREKRLQIAEFNEFLNKHGSKITPDERPYLLSSMIAAAKMDEKVQFGEAQVTVLEAMQKAIEKRPDLVTFGEVATAKSAPDELPAVEFSAPPGYQVDKNALATHSKALAYCQAHKLDPENPGDYARALNAGGKS